MIKIGDFSKLSHLTIKALRFYEKENILIPCYIDKITGYRFYETSQLEIAAKIKAYRQLEFSIDEIKEILSCKDTKSIFLKHAKEIENKKNHLEISLSIINHLLKEKDMKYQVLEKETPACIVYYSEGSLKKYSDIMEFIPMCGAKCYELNPTLKCTYPEYEFVEYLDGMHKETNIKIRHSQAVEKIGNESDFIKFKELPSIKVLSIFHKGPYDNIGEAYAYLCKYAEENGYEVNGLARECYIDGIWNKESIEDWLTEIQLPIK